MAVTVGVIWNPEAGAGRMRRQWPRIRAALQARFPDIRFAETQGPRHAGVLVSQLVADGAELVVAVGGDGTVSEIAEGLLRLGPAYASMVGLGIVPIGTGSDLARGLGLAGSSEARAASIAERPPRIIDAGRADFVDQEGREEGRHFVNVASVGVSAAIAADVNRSRLTGRMRGRIAFLLHTVRRLLTWRFVPLRVIVDGRVVAEEPLAAVVVANGRYFGGGMMIAPDARLDDGLFDVILIRGRSRWELIRALRLVYSGRHLQHPACSRFQGRTVRVEPCGKEGAAVELDGEPVGSIPARFEVLNGPLSLRG